MANFEAIFQPTQTTYTPTPSAQVKSLACLQFSVESVQSLSPSFQEFQKEVAVETTRYWRIAGEKLCTEVSHPALGVLLLRCVRGEEREEALSSWASTSGRSVSERRATCHSRRPSLDGLLSSPCLLRYRSCCPAAMLESLSKAPSLLLHHRFSPGPCFTGSPTCCTNT